MKLLLKYIRKRDDIMKKDNLLYSIHDDRYYIYCADNIEDYYNGNHDCVYIVPGNGRTIREIAEEYDMNIKNFIEVI